MGARPPPKYFFLEPPLLTSKIVKKNISVVLIKYHCSKIYIRPIMFHQVECSS